MIGRMRKWGEYSRMQKKNESLETCKLWLHVGFINNRERTLKNGGHRECLIQMRKKKREEWDCCLSQKKQYKLRKNYFLNLLGSIYNHLYRYTRNKDDLRTQWTETCIKVSPFSNKNMHQCPTSISNLN